MKLLALFLCLAPLFGFVVVLMVACAFALRVNLPMAWFGYLVLMLLTHMLAFYFLFKTSVGQIPNPSYLPVYSGSTVAAVVLMGLLTFQFSRNLPSVLSVLFCLAAMGFGAAVVMVIRWWLLGVYQTIPSETTVTLAHSWVLFVCGACALASFLPEPTALGKVFRIALGLYWLAISCTGFSITVGFIKSRDLSIKLNLVIPAVIGIAAFGWLAYSLSGLQSETSRETVPNQIQVEAQQ